MEDTIQPTPRGPSSPPWGLVLSPVPSEWVGSHAPSLSLQCAPGGCLMELCIQLSIIMLGKQLIQNNLFEIGIP